MRRNSLIRGQKKTLSGKNPATLKLILTAMAFAGELAIIPAFCEAGYYRVCGSF